MSPGLAGRRGGAKRAATTATGRGTKKLAATAGAKRGSSARTPNPAGRRRTRAAVDPTVGRRSGPPAISARRDEGLGGNQVEGRQAVLELLRAGRRAVRQILMADGIDVEGGGADGPIAEILTLADRRGVPVRSVPRGRLDAAAGTAAPQGVVASAEPIQPAELADLARRPAPGGGPPLLVVLDGITDPHNLGAIMRSAVGAGASGVVLGRHRSARLTPAAVKAAAGAVEHLPVALAPGIPGALRDLAAAGVWTVGLEADATDDLWGLRVATEAIAVVLGAEGRGLARLTRDVCELTVSIPLAGTLGSLNVSAAAALACFEVARGRASTQPG